MFTFEQESGRVKATISELELKHVMTKIQQMEIDAKSRVYMKKHLIVQDIKPQIKLL